MSRKYRQRGYQDYGPQEKGERPERPDRPDKPEKKERGPSPRARPHDHLGPRTPRMVGTVMRARCSNCGTVLAPGFDIGADCPKCGLAMHCCKQCVHFDTAARFECTQPIPERIPKKDARNECTFFEFRRTVEKDTTPSSQPAVATTTESVRPDDARKAFEDLFKK